MNAYKSISSRIVFQVIIICGMLGIFMSSCKTPSMVQGFNLKKRTVPFLLKKLEEGRLEYDWFAAKAKVKFEGQGQNISFSAILRMRTDSIIWMKIQKISVEGMRVRMTKEKIEVLNRQDNQYIVETFETIKNKMPLSIQLRDMEDLLVGNPLVKENIDFQVSSEEGFYLLNGDVFDSKDKKNKIGNIKLWMDENYHLTKILAKVDDNTIQADYSDFQDVNGKTSIPFEKDISLNSPEAGNIRFKISFSKVELNEVQDLKFEIPDHYEHVISGKKIERN